MATAAGSPPAIPSPKVLDKLNPLPLLAGGDAGGERDDSLITNHFPVQILRSDHVVTLRSHYARQKRGEVHYKNTRFDGGADTLA